MRFVLHILGAALCGAPAAFSQDVDAAMLDQGKLIFETDCAICHQVNGVGDPPTFPALSGNAQLGDLSKIVMNIHQGQANMPPFPDFTAEQIAGIATYIRNSWGNAFGGVDTDEVTALLQGMEPVGEQASIWDGVFTVEQAERGKQAYGGVCSSCHGRRLDGAPDDPDQQSAPPLARYKFLGKWKGQTIASLFEFSRATMPKNNPSFMSDQEYIDIVAHMLASSNVPAGDAELATDPASLALITIEEQP